MRTRGHVELPEGESFVVEYVTDQSWSGYNWYQGGYHSLIQVNVDFPSLIDRAVDLAQIAAEDDLVEFWNHLPGAEFAQ